MANDKPVGQKFSDVYTERGVPTDDSAAARGRIGHFLANLHTWEHLLTAKLREETGVSVYPGYIVEFFDKCDLRQFLNSITCLYLVFPKVARQAPDMSSGKWLDFVRKVLKQENMAYTVDDEGGVHPAFDQEFDASRRETIAMLGKPRYAAARKFFDDAIADLKQPRDTRDAVRKTFEAVENVSKLMCPDIERLGATEVKRHLQPIALAGTSDKERDARGRMIESLAEWMNGCQKYRHAAGQPEPTEPSLDLAILMVSQGASWLRWLITLDQTNLP
jgi:hypothetical protein